jgi:ABC-2 type transport system ATP-binding protein
MSAIIHTERLTKVYPSKSGVKAIENVHLSVNRGEIFGFLGPNGAGKTTTIRILLDHIRPTSGKAMLFGMDSRADSVAIHAKVGFLPAELSLWKSYTAREVVSFLARARGDKGEIVREAQVLAERLQLDLSKRVREFSTGNKRKLGLVIALMHKPELLILDEPTSGLDPLLQQTFNQLMLEVKAEGRTVFLSSHMLSEVQAICERVAVIRDGQIRAVESVEKLINVGFRKVSATLKAPLSAETTQHLRQLAGVTELSTAPDTFKLNYSGDFNALLQTLSHASLKDLLITEPTLEEIFLTFYGNSNNGRKAN